MEYLIKTKSIGNMTEEQFFQFCQENDSIQFERDAMGDIIMMEPTGSDTERLNSDIALELGIWNRKMNRGYVFGNNGGFTLPNKAVRSPDAAFISKIRYDALSKIDCTKFAHICPDFVIELLSENDRLWTLENKMKEWIQNGCRLAWMINPNKKETTVYRANGEIEIVPFSKVLNGEDVLPGFELKVSELIK